MTRADIIQIIFGIHSDEMDDVLDLLRNKCKYYNNDCTDCNYNDCAICPLFWTESLVEDEWEDCIRRFTILYNTYNLGHQRGYIEGEKHQHELLERREKNENEISD